MFFQNSAEFLLLPPPSNYDWQNLISSSCPLRAVDILSSSSPFNFNYDWQNLSSSSCLLRAVDISSASSLFFNSNYDRQNLSSSSCPLRAVDISSASSLFFNSNYDRQNFSSSSCPLEQGIYIICFLPLFKKILIMTGRILVLPPVH